MIEKMRHPPGWLMAHDVPHWAAARACKKPEAKTFRPRTVRLSGMSPEQQAARCFALTAELLKWVADKAKVDDVDKVRFDGTLKSLARIYETHPESPCRAACYATQRIYAVELAVLIKAVGDRRVDRITGADLRRWHANFAAPKHSNGEPRLRRAQGCMKALRRIVSWGVQLKLTGCVELRTILQECRFAVPAAREAAPTYEQMVAFIAAAHEAGRLSMALAAAAMFDTSLRQTDVIGKWEPVAPGSDRSGYVHHGRRWTGGLVWQDIRDGELTKRTTKTGAVYKSRIADNPLLSAEIAKVPEDRRIGPMIIAEQTGRPYRHRWFAAIWRRIARKAGIPDSIWSRDTRAGAITEAFDAGAELEHVRQMATHSDPKVTGRYNRGSPVQTSTVAILRARHRTKGTD